MVSIKQWRKDKKLKSKKLKKNEKELRANINKM
jgi:hypothetical protein